jgi:O-antigen/teichoic acid export membrane protein
MVKKNFFYYLSPSVLTGIISLFIIVPVSTYYLEPKDFGIIGIITVFSGLVVPFSSIGVGWVLGSNYYKVNAQERGKLIFNTLVLGIILRTFWVVIFWLCGLLFLPRLIRSYEDTYILFFCLFLIAEWFKSVWEIVSYTIVLQKRGNIFAFLDITQVLSHLAVLVVCLAILRLKTISLVLAYLGSALGGFLFSVIYIRKYIAPKISAKWLKEIIKLSLPVIPLNIFEVISNSLDRFFIERWVSLSGLGIYTHSLYYRKMFMKPQKAFSRTYSPEVLEAISEGNGVKLEKARDYLKKWFGLLAIVGMGVVLFAKEAIDLLTHGKFTAAAPLVSLWFILILIYSFGIPYTQFLFIHKKIKFVFLSEMILSIISWIIIVLSVYFFGAMGAAVSILLYFFSLNSIRKIYAMRLGCINFEGANYWIPVILILGLLVFNVYSFAIIPKILFFLTTSVLLAVYFDTFSYIKSYLSRTKNEDIVDSSKAKERR